MVRLRGHHLLCLLGYQGMGYSPEYVANMTAIHTRLRRTPDTPVEIVEGPDLLCQAFPADDPAQPVHCEEERVMWRDAQILARLGLRPGAVISWQEILDRIIEDVAVEDIPQFCHTCPWLSYGVCEAGLARLKRGEGLLPVDSATTAAP